MNLRSGRLNLPNLLTLARVAAVPVLVVLLLSDSRASGMWAASIFGLAAVTDFVDGWLARKWGVVTVLGKFLDPLADKLIVMAALIMLIPLDRVPAWAVFMILAREMVVTGLRSIASSEMDLKGRPPSWPAGPSPAPAASWPASPSSVPGVTASPATPAPPALYGIKLILNG